jgi:hypothetical protein
MASLVINNIVEAGSRRGVDGVFASEALPSPNRSIDVKGVELDTAANPPDALGRQ